MFSLTQYNIKRMHACGSGCQSTWSSVYPSAHSCCLLWNCHSLYICKLVSAGTLLPVTKRTARGALTCYNQVMPLNVQQNYKGLARILHVKSLLPVTKSAKKIKILARIRYPLYRFTFTEMERMGRSKAFKRSTVLIQYHLVQ